MKVHINIVPKNDKPIKQVLEDLMSSNKKIGKGYATKRIKVAWKEKMGPTINSYTKKIFLSKGCLYINITSAPLRQELSMSKANIIEMLNQELGAVMIKEVVIR